MSGGIEEYIRIAPWFRPFHYDLARFAPTKLHGEGWAEVPLYSRRRALKIYEHVSQTEPSFSLYLREYLSAFSDMPRSWLVRGPVK